MQTDYTRVNTGFAVFTILSSSRKMTATSRLNEVGMETRMHKSSLRRDWKEIYKAALFEDDNSKIPQRIAEAERALAARALELFGASDDQIREQRAMENARYFLRVLGTTQGILTTPSKHVNQTQTVHSAAA